ncbi:MAG: mechanosensitive ion channel family protein [Candidatus Sericytochromatia bacterium]|uniref:Mechanosensitive ion channel family protein n=1 Tax=Candidatus Tanganyikabacteria bacterium TaxID=2961651 RepID=A0A937X8G4_9BACT|nr:mechanosensitive ion channel family protein [Candidatus Tanganyikabacteria bacterium]
MATANQFYAILKPAFLNVQAMFEKFVAQVPQLVIGLALFWVSLKVANISREWARAGVMQATRGDREASQVLGQVMYVAVIVAGIAGAAAVMGVGLSSVLAGLGVTGVVAGFAFRDILENFLAGILLLLTRPFSIGDAIKTNEFEGTVRAITTRSTVIETFDGLMVIVPNAKIYANPLTNFSSLPTRRTTVMLKVAYDRNLAEIVSQVNELTSKVPGILADPKPDIVATTLDERTVTLEVRYWTPRADVFSAKGAFLAAAKTDIYRDEPPPSEPR